MNGDKENSVISSLDDPEKGARYIVHTNHMGRHVLTEYFYHYHRAVFSIFHRNCDDATITDINYWPLAKYQKRTRLYHFTEDPSWLNEHQWNVNTE